MFVHGLHAVERKVFLERVERRIAGAELCDDRVPAPRAGHRRPHQQNGIAVADQPSEAACTGSVGPDEAMQAHKLIT